MSALVLYCVASMASSSTSTAAVGADAELFAFVTPGRGWTAEAIAQAAVERSPSVQGAQARLEAARARSSRASAELLPRTLLSARYTRLSEIDNDPLVNLSIDLDAARAGVAQIGDPATRAVLGAQLEQLSGLAGASIEIPQNQIALSAQLDYPVSQLFFEILPGLRARKEAARAAEAETDVARNVAALEAIEAFLGHARARSVQVVAARSVEEARLNAEAARARLKNELGTRPDLLRFEARLAGAERELAERTAAVSASAAALRTLVGMGGSGPVDIGQSLVRDLPRPAVLSGEALVERALDARDELRAVLGLIQAKRASEDAAGGGMWPKLLASARFDYANPNNLYVPPGDEFRSSWSVSGVLQWSPAETWKASRDKAAATAEVREALAQQAALQDLVRIEVRRTEALFSAARTTLEASQRALTAAQEGYAAVSRGYELGVFDATDLIDAELQLQRARLGLVDAGISLRLRHARLRRAVGEHLWE